MAVEEAGPVAEQIRARIAAALAPEALEVIDESARHEGHAGWREGGQTHFRVRLRARRLEGMSRIARHRAVHEAIGRELIGRIHALAIEFID